MLRHLVINIRYRSDVICIFNVSLKCQGMGLVILYYNYQYSAWFLDGITSNAVQPCILTVEI